MTLAIHVARLWASGSPAIHALAIIGLVTLVTTGHRAWTLYARYNIDATAFMKHVRRLIANGDLGRVLKLCQAAPAALVVRATSRVVSAAAGGRSAIAIAAREATDDARAKLASPATILLRLLTLCAVGVTFVGMSFTYSKAGPAPHEELAATASAILWLGVGVTALGCAGLLVLGRVARRLLADVERVGGELRDVLVARRS